ncbi:MAG TPA: DUF2092 domain-containing protein [Gemmataceae bacterium]|jgi:hypothetical protein|nr:DUF2092 domain-containing protein [Gemmataceae bacterium]
MNCRVALCALAFALVLPLSLLSSARAKPLPAVDDLDKKVLEIVKKTGDLYKDAKSIQAEGNFDSKITGQGDDKEIKVSASYEVAKPLSLSLKTKVDGDAKKGPNVIADGKNLFIYQKGMKQYMEQDSPATLGEIGLGLLMLDSNYTGMLFANILGDDPADLLMQGVTACSYVGLDKVGETPVHRMKFTQQEFEWELWVASEGKPYVMRFISTREGNGIKIVTTETYKNWKLDAPAAKETFTFKAPEGVAKVDMFGAADKDK